MLHHQIVTNHEKLNFFNRINNKSIACSGDIVCVHKTVFLTAGINKTEIPTKMGSDFERNFEEHLNYFWLYGVAGVIQQQSLLLQLAP